MVIIFLMSYYLVVTKRKIYIDEVLLIFRRKNKMSFERACVNCERCFDVANKLVSLANIDDDDDTQKKYARKQHNLFYKNKISFQEVREAIMKNPEYRKNKILEELALSEEVREGVYATREEVYATRNEAMRALEKVQELDRQQNQGEN